MPIPPPVLLSIGRHAPPNGWHLPAHRHGPHELVVLVRGRERVRTLAGDCVAAAGDVLCFAPGVAHEEWQEGAEPLESFFLTFAAPAGAAPWPLLTADGEGRVQQLAAWTFSLRGQPGPAVREAQQAFLRAMLAELRRLALHRELPLVTAVREAVRQDAGIRLDELARRIGLSRFHFVRRYRALTGRTPMADARLFRLERARDLLLTGTLPVKAIAVETGFGSERALYRLFGRHFHTTPGGLRAAAGGPR